jgi:type IV pilus assembly protein PilN
MEMARINLLPWRETQRLERARQVKLLAVLAALVALGLLAAIHLQIEAQITTQNQRNGMLKTAIAEFEAELETLKALQQREGLIRARMNVIQRLQLSRPLAVQLFDSLARTIPQEVYVNAVSERNRTLLISGTAQSDAAVSAYLRSLEAWHRFGTPQLSIITTRPQTDRRVSAFELRVPTLAGRSQTRQ